MLLPPCLLLGAPVDSGKRRAGCLMGPDAYRTAGLAAALGSLGRETRDLGNLAPAPRRAVSAANPALHSLSETVAWTEALTDAARDAMAEGFPIFL
ncbi:MAG: arginase family protein, partial [Roseicyclus sp.]|nr:arginase family protein [Roseicyclus sp.]